MRVFPGNWFTNRTTVSVLRARAAETGEAEAADQETGQAEGADQGPTAPALAPGNVGTLVSAEALNTFGGWTLAVTVIWGVWDRLSGMPHSDVVGAIVSLVVGILLFWDDQADPNRKATPTFAKRLLAAIVNTCVIFGAASAAVGAANTAVPPAAHMQPASSSSTPTAAK